MLTKLTNYLIIKTHCKKYNNIKDELEKLFLLKVMKKQRVKIWGGLYKISGVFLLLKLQFLKMACFNVLIVPQREKII